MLVLERISQIAVGYPIYIILKKNRTTDQFKEHRAETKAHHSKKVQNSKNLHHILAPQSIGSIKLSFSDRNTSIMK